MFKEMLESIIERTEGSLGALIMGTDGIAVEKVVAETGWPLKVAPTVETTAPPSAQELSVLRDLQERTARAHAGTT